MRTQDIKLSYFIFDTVDELSSKQQELLKLAKSSLQNAYAPYSGFQVGAAVLLANGAMLGSSNYENAAYPLCVCAEHAALANASHRFPGIPVVALAVTVNNEGKNIDHPAPPCGGCRQIICETEKKNGQDIEILLQGSSGAIFVFETGKTLLPLGFDGSYL